MSRIDLFAILKLGVDAWNEWKKGYPNVRFTFDAAKLKGLDLAGIDFSGVSFHESYMRNIDLENANLSYTNLSEADLHYSNLRGANLHKAHLWGTNLGHAELSGADFTGAEIALTKFVDNDLSNVKGLEDAEFTMPSTVGLDTIYRSQGKIPESFLRGCGVPEEFITYAHSLVTDPVQYQSCFISYSHKDEEFAKRLHAKMQQEKLRVWYAPEHMKGGAKIHEQIELAIQVHARLLLVLSQESMSSEWVNHEIFTARQREVREKRRILFPIGLVDFKAIKAWKAFDGDTGRDMAREIREYFIPDFSNWKDHDSFETGFSRLLRDLKAESK